MTLEQIINELNDFHGGDEKRFQIFKKIYQPRFDINYCPMCR